MEFYQIYRPLTAAPFKDNNIYMEYQPCSELKPYIRCFWEMKKPSETLVIPDTCMDIMFDINYSDNKIVSTFCGINDTAFQAALSDESHKLISTFGIRFYAWAAVLFSEDSMEHVKNIYVNAEHYFGRLKKEIEELLFEAADISSRIAITEKYLLKQIHPERNNRIVMETVSRILLRKGNIKIFQLEQEVHTSSRQIERVFKEYVGISPKQLSSLVRYQYLWNDIIYKRDFNILDEVHQLGYTDQAHLLRDFKRFHRMTPSEARNSAIKDVAFLQENI